MEEKEQFCRQVVREGVSVAHACREFTISRQTGYEVLARYLEEGREGLAARSHRPHTSPNRIPRELEEAVVRARSEHPAWGARKLSAYLEGAGLRCPKTTIGRVLKRNGLIDSTEAAKHKAWKRFESSEPNEVWQMDFTDFRLSGCTAQSHVLVILDDASRFLLKLGAYPNERRGTVEEALRGAFETYGMPEVILTDNGAPWGSCGMGEGYTKLSVWLIRLNIKPVHARAYHPQTIGKVERFNRTLRRELGLGGFRDLAESQRALDDYLAVYNFERPHSSLELKVPANLYHSSL